MCAGSDREPQQPSADTTGDSRCAYAAILPSLHARLGQQEGIAEAQTIRADVLMAQGQFDLARQASREALHLLSGSQNLQLVLLARIADASAQAGVHGGNSARHVLLDASRQAAEAGLAGVGREARAALNALERGSGERGLLISRR
jgi:hypothetical protein